MGQLSATEILLGILPFAIICALSVALILSERRRQRLATANVSQKHSTEYSTTRLAADLSLPATPIRRGHLLYLNEDFLHPDTAHSTDGKYQLLTLVRYCKNMRPDLWHISVGTRIGFKECILNVRMVNGVTQEQIKEIFDFDDALLYSIDVQFNDVYVVVKGISDEVSLVRYMQKLWNCQ